MRGCDIGGFWIRDGVKGLDFGETDQVGYYWSRLQNIYGYQVDELVHLTNIQGVRGDHIRSRLGHRVLRIDNDVTETPSGEDSPHTGANAVFVDPFIYTTDLDNGDHPDGGILLETTDQNVTGLGGITFIRP